MARRTRDGSTRGLSTRATEEREIPAVDNSGDDPLHIPREVQRRFTAQGFTLGWVRRACMNMEDGTNVRQRSLKGWKPVASDQAPELVAPEWGLAEHGAPVSRFIQVGGSVLCQIPTSDFKKMIAAQNREAMAAIDQPYIEKIGGAQAVDESDRVRIERVGARVSADAFKE